MLLQWTRLTAKGQHEGSLLTPLWKDLLQEIVDNPVVMPLIDVKHAYREAAIVYIIIVSYPLIDDIFMPPLWYCILYYNWQQKR